MLKRYYTTKPCAREADWLLDERNGSYTIYVAQKYLLPREFGSEASALAVEKGDDGISGPRPCTMCRDDRELHQYRGYGQKELNVSSRSSAESELEKS